MKRKRFKATCFYLFVCLFSLQKVFKICISLPYFFTHLVTVVRYASNYWLLRFQCIERVKNNIFLYKWSFYLTTIFSWKRISKEKYYHQFHNIKISFFHPNMFHTAWNGRIILQISHHHLQETNNIHHQQRTKHFVILSTRPERMILH